MCSMAKSFATAPRSFAGRASGWVLPSSTTRFMSSTLCVIRGRACRPDSTCALTAGAAISTARTTRDKDPHLRTMGPLSYTKICPKQSAERDTPAPKERERTVVRRQVDGRVLMPENSQQDVAYHSSKRERNALPMSKTNSGIWLKKQRPNGQFSDRAARFEGCVISCAL